MQAFDGSGVFTAWPNVRCNVSTTNLLVADRTDERTDRCTIFMGRSSLHINNMHVIVLNLSTFGLIDVELGAIYMTTRRTVFRFIGSAPLDIYFLDASCGSLLAFLWFQTIALSLSSLSHKEALAMSSASSAIVLPQMKPVKKLCNQGASTRVVLSDDDFKVIARVAFLPTKRRATGIGVDHYVVIATAATIIRERQVWGAFLAQTIVVLRSN